MAKIIGNTTATPTPISDWNQTNPNKADYIKNKPTIPSVDDALSDNSENPVQNKVVNAAINSLNDLIGDTSVSDQIGNAVAQKSLIQFVTWEEND